MGKSRGLLELGPDDVAKAKHESEVRALTAADKAGKLLTHFILLSHAHKLHCAAICGQAGK